ncbi:hypothetical protein F183_A10530 [Bryobacterales bacterium F-183]|nr:hypothetical protein F183_A10530 [Bryobacterales bacterium F-183]
MKRSLTSKQANFVGGVASGLSLADAYRRAYNASGSSPHTIHVEASRTARHPVVAPRIKAEIDRRIRCSGDDGSDARELIASALEEQLRLLSARNSRPQDVIRVCRALGSLPHVNAFGRFKEEGFSSSVSLDETVDALELAIKEAFPGVDNP